MEQVQILIYDGFDELDAVVIVGGRAAEAHITV